MRLKNLIIEEEYKGLQPVTINKHSFGDVVALIGPNGAGKSRVLSFINEYLTNTNPINPIRENLVLKFNNAIHSSLTSENLRKLVNNHVKLVSVDSTQVKNTLDYKTMMSGTNINSLSNIRNEFTSLDINSIISYLHGLSRIIVSQQADMAFKAFDEKKIPNDVNSSEKNEFDSFNDILKTFISKEFSFERLKQGNSYNAQLLFDEQDFDFQMLSPGEQLLFKYAAILFLHEKNTKSNIRDCIIIFDEPETHLHPKFQIEVIDKFKELIKGRGQLWIATHSVHILSHLGYENVLMVSENQVFPPSRTNHQRILRQLVENKKHIEEVRSMMNSIGDWHYAMFIKECFEEPTVVSSTSTNDPQYRLLKEHLKAIENSTLLDFGAGFGRVGLTLKEDKSALENIEYHAFEISKDNIDYLQQINLTPYLYTTHSEIPKGNFDFVIMCNVLHEINPDEWEGIFNAIQLSLKDSGHLLILEDIELVRGESAHEYGYIILSPSELETLFSLEQVLKIQPNEEALKDRLYLLSVPKNKVVINDESLVAAIIDLKENLFNKISIMKNSEVKDELHARRYAHFSQLYINAELYLKSTEKKQ